MDSDASVTYTVAREPSINLSNLQLLKKMSKFDAENVPKKQDQNSNRDLNYYPLEAENDALSRAGEKAKAKRKDAVSEEIERIRQESMAAGVEMDAQTDTETLIRSGMGNPKFQPPSLPWLKPGNPLDDWGKFSAGTEHECHKCLATHSMLWHHFGPTQAVTCNACFLQMEPFACPYCGTAQVKRDEPGMKLCPACQRLSHSSCEEQYRGAPHSLGICVACELAARVDVSDFDIRHRGLLSKHLSTLLNHHIFHFKHFFSPHSSATPRGFLPPRTLSELSSSSTILSSSALPHTPHSPHTPRRSMQAASPRSRTHPQGALLFGGQPARGGGGSLSAWSNLHFKSLPAPPDAHGTALPASRPRTSGTAFPTSRPGTSGLARPGTTGGARLWVQPQQQQYEVAARVDCWRTPDRRLQRGVSGRPATSPAACRLAIWDATHQRAGYKHCSTLQPHPMPSTPRPNTSSSASPRRSLRPANLARPFTRERHEPPPSEASVSVAPPGTRPGTRHRISGRGLYGRGPPRTPSAPGGTGAGWRSSGAAQGGEEGATGKTSVGPSYDAIMRVITVEMESFGGQLLNLVPAFKHRPAQDFRTALEEIAQRDAELVSHESSGVLDPDSVGAQFHFCLPAIQRIAQLSLHYYFQVDGGKFVKVARPQAMAMVMRSFGVYPALIGTSDMFRLILEIEWNLVDGQRATAEERFERELMEVIRHTALYVLRYDPLGLGLRSIFSEEATDAHLVRVLLTFMELDDAEVLAGFERNFHTGEQAQEVVEERERRAEMRRRLLADLDQHTDAACAAINAWNPVLRDLFVFFSTDNKGRRNAINKPALAVNVRLGSMTMLTGMTANLSAQLGGGGSIENPFVSVQRRLRRGSTANLLSLSAQDAAALLKESGESAEEANGFERWGDGEGVVEEEPSIELGEEWSMAERLRQQRLLDLKVGATNPARLFDKHQVQWKAGILAAEDDDPSCQGGAVEQELRDKEARMGLFKAMDAKQDAQLDQQELLAFCGPEDFDLGMEVWRLLPLDPSGKAGWMEFLSAAFPAHLLARLEAKVPGLRAAPVKGRVKSRRDYLEFPQEADCFPDRAHVTGQQPLQERVPLAELREELHRFKDGTYHTPRHILKEKNIKRLLQVYKTRYDSLLNARNRNGFNSFTRDASGSSNFGVGPQSYLGPVDGGEEEETEKDQPEGAMPRSEFLKLALIFGLLGSPAAVREGEAIMEDWQLLECMDRFGLTPETEEAPLDITWPHFTDLFRFIATDALTQRLQPPEVLVDQSVANQVEFLFWFMGLPTPDLAAEDASWLHNRLIDYASFHANALLSLPLPPAVSLLPPGNAPWREGLMLHQSIQVIEEEAFAALFPSGIISRPLTAQLSAPPTPLPSSPASLPLTPVRAGSGPSLLPRPLTTLVSPRRMSVAMSMPDSPINSLGNVSPGANNRGPSSAADDAEEKEEPATPPPPWWVVMFRARGPEPKQEGAELLLQAAAWRHECPFYLVDLDRASEVFIRRFNIKIGTSMRLYSADGFYREYIGPWTEPSALEQWLQGKGLQAVFASGRPNASEQDSTSAARFLEVASGLQEYLTSWRSMAQRARADALPPPAHVKGLALQLHTRVLCLDHQRLSVHQAFAVAHALRFNRKLRTLSLRGCHLSLQALEGLLLSLAFNSVLSSLDLSLNPFGPPDLIRHENGKLAVTTSSVIAALAELFRFSNSLEKVSLSGVGLDDVAGGALAESLYGNRDIPLMHLDLSGNNLGNKTAELLAEAIGATRDMLGDEVLHDDTKYLRVLDLSNNKMSSRATAVLEEASRMHPPPAEGLDVVDPVVLLLDHQRAPDPTPAPPPAPHRATEGMGLGRLASPGPGEAAHTRCTEGGEAAHTRFAFLLRSTSEESRSLEERLHLLRTSSRAISRDPAHPPLRLSAEQGHRLLEPFVDSRLLSQAAQWVYCFLTSPEHKEAFSEHLDVLLLQRRRRLREPAEEAPMHWH